MSLHFNEKKHLSCKGMLGQGSRFWRRQQSIFTELYVPSWEDLFLWIIDRSKSQVKAFNSS